MNTKALSVRDTVVAHSLYGIRATLFPLWLSVMFVVVGVRVGIAIFNEFDASVWSVTASSSNIYLGVVGIILTPIVMPMYVSSSLTRRHFSTGVAIILAGTALAVATIMLVGFGIEHVAYSQADISDSLDHVNVFGSAERIGVVFSSILLQSAAFFCSGWLIGATYYRLGGFLGTVVLPATLLPAMLSEYFVGMAWGWDPVEVSGPVRVYGSAPGWIFGDLEIPYAIGAIIVSLVIAAGVWAAFRILRDVTIK